MFKKIRSRRPSGAMVVACLALFVALGGASVAAIKLKPNSVKTKTIKNSAVKTSKIADNAVTEPKLAAEAVTAGKLGPGSLTKAGFAASGTATSTSGYTLTAGASPVCTLDTNFSAPGVRPGDAVVLSLQDVAGVGGLISISPGENEIAVPDKLQIEVCNNLGTAVITAGSIKIDWVAIR